MERRERTNSGGDLKGFFEQISKRKRAENSGAETGKMKEKLDKILGKLEKMETNIDELKAEFKNKEKKWEEEKKQLVERIAKLEQGEENREKEKRRNNIIINGLEEEGEVGAIVAELARSLQLNTRVVEAVRLGKKTEGKKRPVLVKCSSWEDKRNILAKKGALRDKGSTIYIDEDLTRKEREIQMKLKRKAREERSKGKRVMVRYQKMCIEEEWWFWNEVKDILEKGESKQKN